MQEDLTRDIPKDILQLLFEANGKPFSLKQFQNEFQAKGKKYDLRSIEKAVSKLEENGKVGTTQLAKAIAVYLYRNLPFVPELADLDEIGRSGNYPIYAIIAKMKDVGFPEKEIYPETSSTIIGRRTRDLMESAEKEVMWWAGDFSRYDELKPFIEGALKKKELRFRILMRIDWASVKNAAMLLDLQQRYPNLELRHWESQWRGAIFDRKKARLIEKSPKGPEARLKVSNGNPGTDEDFKYDGFFIDGSKTNLSPWVYWLCTVWEDHWRRAELNPEVSTLVRTLSEFEHC